MALTDLIEEGNKYRCPITQLLIKDPVYIDDDERQFFERAAILAYFKDHDTNPRTLKKVKSKELKDFAKLKQEIAKYTKKVTLAIAYEANFEQYNEEDIRELESILQESGENDFKQDYMQHALQSLNKCLKKWNKKKKKSKKDIKANNDLLYQELVINAKPIFDKATENGVKIDEQDIKYAQKVNSWATRNFVAIMTGAAAVGGVIGAAAGVGIAYYGFECGEAGLMAAGIAGGVVGVVIGCLIAWCCCK